jgi:ADP-heptose:LPS heptosyltransferase
MSVNSPSSPRRVARHALRRLARLGVLRLLAGLGRFAVRRAAPAKPRRILVIKPDHLGDLLLATPALRRLRQQQPQARITALVGPWSALVLAHNPDIDALQTLPFPGFERRPKAAPPGQVSLRHRFFSLLQPYRELLRYALLLRAGQFDLALLLRDDHWWGAALALLAGIPLRIGYAVPECRPFLTRTLPWTPAEHVTRQALALVAAVDADYKTRPELIAGTRDALRFAPVAADAAWAEAWVARHLDADERLVVLHPGTGGAAKLWLAARWATVADALADHPGVRLLLTGGPGEAELVEAVVSQMRHPALTLVGATSVGQLAALLGQAALVLGVDSGPLHLAVSQGTPSLHLFGPGDAGRFGPWGDPARHVVVQAGLWCSPCGVFTACPRQTDPPECMQHIAVAEVLRVARTLLGAT